MIEATCRTNLDGYEREVWPRLFAAIPREGDYVAARSGQRLKVCRVTHMSTKPETWDKAEKPYIEVELTNSRHGAI